jgi:LmbE family N-acetylglucosaminyl deacetylase
MKLSFYQTKPFIKTMVFLTLLTIILLPGIFFLSARFFAIGKTATNAFKAPRRVLVVFAHTDDEVTNSGLLRHWANQGSQITLMTLTDGAANPQSDLSVCNAQDTITDCRMRELRDSARILGIRNVRTPLIPDSKLMEHLTRASKLVGEEIASLRPDAILTMEPSGLNGLSDHRAAFLSVALSLQEQPHQSRAFLSVLPPPFAWILPSRIPADFSGSNKVFPLSDSLIEIKAADAAAHRSQSATINGLTLGLGARKLFQWINFETYNVVEADDLQHYINAAR